MKYNYDIHDLKILIIIFVFQYWYHYLENAKYIIIIYIDHKNLEIFMIIKILNRRQAHWIELLIEYNFVLTLISESKNPADDSSRRPDYFENVVTFNEQLLSSFSFLNSRISSIISLNIQIIPRISRYLINNYFYHFHYEISLTTSWKHFKVISKLS